jgi:flagellar biosynthesis/type III secretory pathway M-ring protein FliF/YscJ
MNFLQSSTRANLRTTRASSRPAQKMLTVCLAVAIMIMTLMWWSRYAGDPEMEPVLDQSLSQADIGLITANLDGKGIPHKVVGDRVLVASDQKTEVLAELGYAQALPKNFSNAFDELIKQSNPFTSPEQNDRLFMRAKEAELEAILCNLPDVANASVVIDPTNEQRFDAASIQPSASVTITTQRSSGGEARLIANSAAQIVSGAQAGLQRSRINVVVDGAPFKIEDPDDNGLMDGNDIVENQQQQEHFYEDKVRNEFGFIPGLMVSVTVQVDSSASEIKTHTVSSDPKQMVHVEQQTEEQTTDETGAASSSAEAGVAANTGVSAAGPSSGGSTSTTDDSKTSFVTDASAKDEVKKQGPGEATVLAASVRVPRSYLADDYRVKNGKDADETTLEQFSEGELAQIAKDVMACTGLKTPDSVVVSSYVDAQPTEAPSVQGNRTITPRTSASARWRCSAFSWCR